MGVTAFLLIRALNVFCWMNEWFPGASRSILLFLWSLGAAALQSESFAGVFLLWLSCLPFSSSSAWVKIGIYHPDVPGERASCQLCCLFPHCAEQCLAFLWAQRKQLRLSEWVSKFPVNLGEIFSEGSTNCVLTALFINFWFGDMLVEVANCLPITATEKVKLGDGSYTAG